MALSALAVPASVGSEVRESNHSTTRSQDSGTFHPGKVPFPPEAAAVTAAPAPAAALLPVSQESADPQDSKEEA